MLLVSDESTVMAGWAEQLAQRGYFRDFGWRSKGRAQPSALFCTSQPTQLKMVRGYEMGNIVATLEIKPIIRFSMLNILKMDFLSAPSDFRTPTS